MNHSVFSTPSADLLSGVDKLLQAAGLASRLAGVATVVIKPNLVEALQPPITTPVGLVDCLVTVLQRLCPHLKIIIGEGTGSLDYDTFHCFKTLGYIEMAKEREVELVDLNKAELVKKNESSFTRWPEMYLPLLLEESFLISVPVLKAHSLAKVTLTMKNMMGCAPPAHYRMGNSWGKSKFHVDIQEAIFDLNQYRAPDFTVLDASVGMAKAHLWGPHCNPPVAKLAASYDPVAIDSYGTSLLGFNWKEIGHIQLAHTKLGLADPLEVIDV